MSGLGSVGAYHSPMATHSVLRPAAAGDRLRRDPAGASELLPRPPIVFGDDEGRRIEIRAASAPDESLVAMYADYDPADRTKGLPPRTESGVRDWLAGVLGTGYDLVARHDGEAVGHATLVPDGDGAHELAIFVASGHQSAGIGSRLLRTLLGHGRTNGVERVWLTVARENRAAVSLYRATGFVTVETGTAHEMERRL